MIPPLMVTLSSTVKSSAIVGAITGTWIVAQSVEPMATPIFERIAREGGFFALVLLLLFFYRRDTKWATEFWKDQAADNAKLIADHSKSQTEVANALRENTIIVHQAKNVMAKYLPNRADDRP